MFERILPRQMTETVISASAPNNPMVTAVVIMMVAREEVRVDVWVNKTSDSNSFTIFFF